MATNKHAVIRYGVLDECLKKQSQDNTEQILRQLCADAISEYDHSYENAEISLRTFRSDIKYLSDKIKSLNLPADEEVMIEKVLSEPDYSGHRHYYYQYSRPGFSVYSKELTNSEIGQLQCAMQMLSRFKGLPEYEGIDALGHKLAEKYQIESKGQKYVDFEHVISTSEEAMSDICNFIINQQPIKITYTPYGKESKKWVIHPYLLKEYNNRWFLFGYNETEKTISNVALDRIQVDYEPSPHPFIPNSFVNFETYFDNIVGVTLRPYEPSEIRFRVSEKRLPYIESKYIHSSQSPIDAKTREFTITVIPNRELDSLILSFGRDLEVLSPAWYRDRIKRIISETNNLYSDVKQDCTPDDFLCNVNQI